MANYAILKTALAQVIKPNGNKEITGQILQDTLIAVINALGTGFQFMGVAQPDTAPGTPDQRVMYLATEAGTYSNFGTPAPVLDGNSVYIFTYADSWTATELDIATKSNLSAYLAIADLASETGQSTTTTMTQKAITTAIISLAEDIETAVEELTQAMQEHVAKLPELVVGSSAGVLGRTVDAAFLFRRTAGTAKIGRGAASLNAIYGRTLVWNQQFKLGEIDSSADISVTKINDLTIKINGTGTTGFWVAVGCLNGQVAGHKYLISVKQISGSWSSEDTGYFSFSDGYIAFIDAQVAFGTSIKTLVEARFTSSMYLAIGGGAVTFNDLVVSFNYIDLTQMFGAGNEPSTVAEFEALYPGYQAYNPGALISNDAAAIKTVGFNKWDEEYIIDSGNLLVSKNNIRVSPSTAYYFKCETGTSATLDYIDTAGNVISSDYGVANAIFNTPTGCAFVKFTMAAAYGTTYRHDICISLSDPTKNGTYEPYWSKSLQLGLSTLTGKLNGQGASVVVFPDGMNGVGTDRDEIRADGKTADKRRARVDLGSLNWSYYNGFFYTNFFDNILTTMSVNYMCVKYVAVSPYGSGWTDGDKVMRFSSGNGAFNIKDSDYTDPAAFKASLNGVYLDYPLATPETYILDEPLQMSYQVENGGTEQAIAPEGATLPSAPFVAQIQYPLDVIALQGDSQADMLDAMVAAGVITAYTMTYNVAAQKYEFTINGVSRNLPENNRKGGGDDEPNGDESGDEPGEEPTQPGNDEPGEPENGEPQEEHEEEAVMSGGDKEPTYEDNGSGNVQPVK